MVLETIGWWIWAALAVACAVGMISARNPVHAALWLVGNLIALAALFLVLAAPVLFAIQLIVYAGAIMVLFLFVIMFFMSPQARQWLRPPLRTQVLFAGILAVAFVVLLYIGFAGGGVEMAYSDLVQADVAAEGSELLTPGLPVALGTWMFSYHVLPFELTSLLLLVAILGAVMVGRDIAGEGRSEVAESAAVIEHKREAG